MTGIKRFIFLAVILLVSFSCVNLSSAKYGSSFYVEDIKVKITSNEKDDITVVLLNEGSADCTVLVNPWKQSVREENSVISGYKSVVTCADGMCYMTEVPTYSTTITTGFKEWDPSDKTISLPAGKEEIFTFTAPDVKEKTVLVEFSVNGKAITNDSIVMWLY